MRKRSRGGIQLLKKRFNPRHLGPGFYAAHASTPAYARLKAMEAVNASEWVGDRYGPGGSPNMWTTWRVHGNGTRVRSNPEIGVGTRFGANACESYVDWPLKWWREAVQNSVDARATQVACNVTEGPEGNLVECIDNGKGMDWEREELVWQGVRIPGFLLWRGVLFDKFLALGGTGKGEAAEGPTIGGFGIAKQLLLLPWAWWCVTTKTRGGEVIRVYGTNKFYGVQAGEAEIRSGVRRQFTLSDETHTVLMTNRGLLEGLIRDNLMPSGEPPPEFAALLDHAAAQGPAFLLPDGMEHGTRLSVFMRTTGPKERCAGKATDESEAHRFITRCFYPSVTFTVNGNEVKAARKPGKHIKTIVEQGTDASIEVHYAKKAPGTTWQVPIRAKDPHRLGYLYLFDAGWVNVPGYVSVEIVGDTRALLTDNREDFRNRAVREAISKFVSTLSKDAQQALKRRPIALEFKGPEGFFRAAEDAARVSSALERFDHADHKAVGDAVGAATDDAEKEPVPGDKPSPPPTGATKDVAEEITKAVAPASPERVEQLIRHLTWRPNMRLLASADLNEEGWKIPKAFLPATMSPANFRLLNVWVALLRFVLSKIGGDFREWGVGFYFDKSLHAAQETVTQGDAEAARAYWFLLNPHVGPSDPRSGAPVLDPRNWEHVWSLFSSAIHEVTHFKGYSEHDTDFADAMSLYTHKVLGHEREVRAMVKAALKKKPPARAPRDTSAEALLDRWVWEVVSREGPAYFDEIVWQTAVTATKQGAPPPERKLVKARLLSLVKRGHIVAVPAYYEKGKTAYSAVFDRPPGAATTPTAPPPPPPPAAPEEDPMERYLRGAPEENPPGWRPTWRPLVRGRR